MIRTVLLALVLLPGCTLVDQTTFNPEAGKRPTFAPVAAAPAVRLPPPGPPALLTLRLAAAGDFQGAVAKAVAAARARKPTVVFDVVETSGATPGPAVGVDAAAVARVIEAQGVPADRVRLLARPEADAPSREVRVYVR